MKRDVIRWLIHYSNYEIIKVSRANKPTRYAKSQCLPDATITAIHMYYGPYRRMFGYGTDQQSTVVE